MIQFKLDQEM